jgi:hypothetical protein
VKRRAVKAEPLSEPSVGLTVLDAVDGGRPFDERDRFVGAATQFELPGDDLARAAVDFCA